ncbi:MAG: hypothetical protein WBA64_04695 [Marinomonas sp.]|uniref:hypothetical protein n=1 Tax=Marinomonas sp. TaxID=1904862 RepID=UPI003C78FC67
MTTKTLIYKVARFNHESQDKNLQDLLTLAFKKKKSALSRIQAGDSENHFKLVNYTGKHKNMQVGDFFDYTHGQKQPLAQFDADVEELKVSTLPPPNDKSDFLHSILYFGIWNNSVILSQTTSLKSPQFEAYLNWILSECELLSEGDYLTLSDNPPLNLQSEIVNTKGIEMHAPITFEPIKSPSKQPDNGAKQLISQPIKETQSVAFRPHDIGWEILKKVLPEEFSFPNQVKASEVLNSSLDVKLLVSWSRLKKDDSTALLDRISNQLRHVESELDYTILTKSGGTITRDDFKLRRQIAVGENDEGLIKRSEMWERMQEWLEILVSEEKIVIEQCN